MRDLALSFLALAAGVLLLVLALSGCGGPGAAEPEPATDRDLWCFMGAARGAMAGGEGDAVFCSKNKDLCELFQLGAAHMAAQGDDDLSIDSLSKCRVWRVAFWVK